MNEKTENIIVKIGVAIYVALCVLAIINPRIWQCNKCCTADQESAQQEEMMSNPQNEEYATMEACLDALKPSENAEPQLIWLKLREGAEVGNLDNYEVDEDKNVSADQLAKILDKAYYVDLNGNTNSGIYSPVAVVAYTSDGDKSVNIIYSFANSQVDISVNGEIVKTGMIYNPDQLYDFLESI